MHGDRSHTLTRMHYSVADEGRECDGVGGVDVDEDADGRERPGGQLATPVRVASRPNRF